MPWRGQCAAAVPAPLPSSAVSRRATRQGEFAPRLMVVTERSIFFLDPATFELRRRIALKDIDRLWLSEFPDNFLAARRLEMPRALSGPPMLAEPPLTACSAPRWSSQVAVPSEHDFFVACTHKSEAVTVLLEAAKARRLCAPLAPLFPWPTPF